MKATIQGGSLKPIENCYIIISGEKIVMNQLPDISDSKSASYNDEPVIGRSFPMKTYSHSENRAITWTAHFIVTKEDDVSENIRYLRIIESAVYPRDESAQPYAPPPVCALRCGSLLTPLEYSSSKEVCAILRSYSVKYPTDVAWDEKTLLPHKFSVDMQWEVVYDSTDLPGSERILRFGR